MEWSLPLIFRLNYAIDLRYGVLSDVARSVAAGRAVDVTTGWVNVIWQGDANARALQCLGHTATPPLALNVTGRERVSIRELAHRFGGLLGRPPVIIGTEAPAAWLADATRSFELLGPVSVTLNEMIEATADWVRRGGATQQAVAEAETIRRLGYHAGAAEPRGRSAAGRRRKSSG